MIQSSWLENPAIKKMDPRKVQVLKKVMVEANGKDMQQSFQCVMAANNTLRKQGLSFSREETKVIIDLITPNMTPQERSQVQMVMNFMNSMRK